MIWNHIKVEDWNLFQHFKTSSPAKRKRAKAIESASKNEHHHHLGQNDFSTARSIWIKDGFYPGSMTTETDSTAPVTVNVNRADDWFCAMHRKDKETGEYVIKDLKTQEVAKKLIEYKKKQTEGVMIPYRNKDALYYALGEKEDHSSRARGFGGVNVSVRTAFAVTDKIKRSRRSITSSEDRDALKEELKEELKSEMRLEFQSSLSSILREMGLPTTNLHDVVKKCTGKDTNYQKSSQKNYEKPPLATMIQDDTSCRLFLKDPHNGVEYEVARGKTFKGDVCHQSVVGSDHISIKLNVVPPEFETLSLPVPVPAYDIYLLIDAVGSLVQWPIDLVRIENNEGYQDGNENDLMGSNSHVSRLSTTPTKTHPEELIVVQSLGQGCQWLQTLVRAMSIGENFTVYFDARSPLFYYKEEGQTYVYQDDLKLFLEGGQLSIAIMQIFMRALQEDLIKDESGVHIGWLCPAATADTRLKKKTEDAIAYVSATFLSSTRNGDEFILAPISDSKHWVLLAICPQTFTIYEFDPITIKEGRKLLVKMVINWALKRFKMSGGQMKLKRNEPLWKSIKCPQQSGGMEHDFFVMRFMYDIVKCCSTSCDLEKVWISHKEEPYNYGEDELNELRDKWASYFTNRCIT